MRKLHLSRLPVFSWHMCLRHYLGFLCPKLGGLWTSLFTKKKKCSFFALCFCGLSGCSFNIFRSILLCDVWGVNNTFFYQHSFKDCNCFQLSKWHPLYYFWLKMQIFHFGTNLSSTMLMFMEHTFCFGLLIRLMWKSLYMSALMKFMEEVVIRWAIIGWNLLPSFSMCGSEWFYSSKLL